MSSQRLLQILSSVSAMKELANSVEGVLSTKAATAKSVYSVKTAEVRVRLGLVLLRTGLGFGESGLGLGITVRVGWAGFALL